MLPFVADADDAPGGAPGKAMLVCATREICVHVYDALKVLRPDWHTDAPTTGAMKIVYSSDSRKDSKELRAHALRDSRRKAVINRAKDPEGELQLLIVNNMLLTGFDAPSIHTMYLDRPLRGAGLMQAFAALRWRADMTAEPDDLTAPWSIVELRGFPGVEYAAYGITQPQKAPDGLPVIGAKEIIGGEVHVQEFRATCSSGTCGFDGG
ncbi:MULTISPECIES: type I restriction enzyme subunit R domain-containing protein [unclassified Streptomyces]|uniref:type I restriction enzyme subunit R domain-containing protein n=1 Tax=unclassified Streptomyces TaxID=2593676 RepID=UPI00082394F1|nr:MULTISPECIES: hypothetical protein [unclassified Streptomyces]SCK16521.1 hypothetical protein YW7DRAFT_01100 [Streptomyces sp. AmelKG-E11A]